MSVKISPLPAEAVILDQIKGTYVVKMNVNAKAADSEIVAMTGSSDTGIGGWKGSDELYRL
jgi:hypothetical protein